jgi:hypothetical protein
MAKIYNFTNNIACKASEIYIYAKKLSCILVYIPLQAG